MTTTRCKSMLLLASLGLAFLSGCQAYDPNTGLTLPSPYYLRHAPQYFPPSDPYPLTKELRSLEEASKKYFDEQRQQ